MESNNETNRSDEEHQHSTYGTDPVLLNICDMKPAQNLCTQPSPNKLIGHLNVIKTLSDSTNSSCEDFYTPPTQQQVSETNLAQQSTKKTFCVSLTTVLSVLGLILSTALIWGTSWAILNEQALPGGSVFALFVLVITCYIGGELITLLTLPPLLGMLVMGIILRNVPYINVAKDLDSKWSAILRSIALVIILLRAGLGLDPNVLRKLGAVCFRLAFAPCSVECAVASVVAHFLLRLPWLWSIMLGFVLAAVSPAVVVPSMLLLDEKKLGTKKGIPTLVIAAASIDDVLAITGFGVALGITFSKGSLVWNIFKGPLEAVIGVCYGVLFGWIMWFVPDLTDNYVNLLRLIELLFGGMFAMFGGRAIEFAGIGALACLTIAFVAAIGWRKKSPNNENAVHCIYASFLLPYIVYVTNLVSSALRSLWQLFQPILFGLIGAEIKFEDLEGSTIGLGIAVLLIGLVFRILTSFVVVSKSGFSLREQLFIAIAWLPKATVQAAFGPVALDYARQIQNDTDAEKLGIKILTVAVLSILLTAPVGAACIALSAPKLLEKDEKEASSQQSDYGICETSSYSNPVVSLEECNEQDTKM